ncbi:MAG TPA: hypothetical protein VGD01_09330 [Candidatus Elarobacter sp.]|jgi:hypothetical protein
MTASVGTWLHWYMIVFFALFGAGMVLWRNELARVGPLIGVAALDGADEARLRVAIERRERLERLPAAAMGNTVGCAALAAAVAGTLTPAPTVILYAVVCVVLAATLAAAYVRLRRAGPRRVASLRARTLSTIVPWWLQTVVAMAVVSPLAFVDVEPVAAVLVTGAALAIAVLGERVARLPAILSDEDPLVDAYVDERLRSVRAVNVLATATAPAYVFEAITLVLGAMETHRFPPFHTTAMLIGLAGLVVGVGAQLILMKRSPGAADVRRWAGA